MTLFRIVIWILKAFVALLILDAFFIFVMIIGHWLGDRWRGRKAAKIARLKQVRPRAC